MSEKRQPWLKWYPSDWRADPGLRMCSFAARGLWVDILGLMHEAEPYGHLLINGRPPSNGQLLSMLGGSSKEIATLIAELESAGVFSRTEEGIIFSRRMIRDKERSDIGREWIKKRWGDTEPISENKKQPNRSNKQNPITPEARGQIPEARDISSSLRSEDSSALAIAVDRWNEVAQSQNLPVVQRLTSPRKAKLRARLNDCGGLEGWSAALEKLASSDFLTGKKTDWKADFDFLLQEKSFTKLMEGAYDNNRANQGKKQSSNGFAELASSPDDRDEEGMDLF
jgi:hypothetical protein